CEISGVTSFDRASIGAEIRRDDGGIATNGGGSAFCDHTPRLKAIDAVADGHDQWHVVLDDEQRRIKLVSDAQQQRTERLRFALGNSCSRLIEAKDSSVKGE